MNVIIAYLETMFSAYPQTPRLLEAKAELLGMMEDAYTGLIASGNSENEAVGQVIRDFGNLSEVAPVLGITADISPDPASGVGNSAPDQAHTAPHASGARQEQPGQQAAHPPRYEAITLQEARSYAEDQERNRFRVSTAVMLFVLSPIAIIVLPVAAGLGVVKVRSEVAVFIGILTILILVAIGVLMIIDTSRKAAPYRRITEGRFSPNPEVTVWARALADSHESARIRALQLAIACWILGPLPLIALSLLLGDAPLRELWTILGVALVLVFTATGLGILLPQAWAHTVSETLSKESGDLTADDEDGGIVGVIAAFYWPILTAVYLLWSFLGNAWGISWILWPIGAIFFGAIAAGGGAIESYRRARR